MTRTNATLEIPADDFAAANERLAKIGLAPTVETRDEQLAADIAEVVSEAQRPALAEQLAQTAKEQTETSTPESRARKTRSDAGKPKPKPKPPAGVEVAIDISFGVNLATQEGQEDVAALLAIWVHNGRDKAIICLFQHLLGIIVKAHEEIAVLKNRD